MGTGDGLSWTGTLQLIRRSYSLPGKCRLRTLSFLHVQVYIQCPRWEGLEQNWDISPACFQLLSLLCRPVSFCTNTNPFVNLRNHLLLSSLPLFYWSGERGSWWIANILVWIHVIMETFWVEGGNIYISQEFVIRKWAKNLCWQHSRHVALEWWWQHWQLTCIKGIPCARQCTKWLWWIFMFYLHNISMTLVLLYLHF